MSILEQIDKTNVRSEPLVWIRRLTLFETLDPPTEIRTVELDTGINIIWGIENDSDDDHFQPGHGVGKTTFCRMIRFCLGEPSYGQEYAEKEILHTFPKGGVAAEIYVNGQKWAIFRPFDKHRSDWAREGVSISDLIADRPNRDSYKEFVAQLSDACLTGIRTDSVLLGGISIQWEHVLAMCTRDQEARYQSLWQWRSSRSNSGSPKIQKGDAFLTLRSILGLLPNAETELQRKLARIATDLAILETKISERKREPEYWIRHFRRSLHDNYGIEEALDASLDQHDLLGLPQLVESQATIRRTNLEASRKELAVLERQTAIAVAALQEPAELQEQDQAVAEVTEVGTDVVLGKVKELREIQRQINEAKIYLCKYGDISIGDCSYAHEQLAVINQQILNVERSTVRESAKRDQIVAALKERLHRRSETIRQLREEVDRLIEKRRELNTQFTKEDAKIEGMQQAISSLLSWERLRSGEEPDSELFKLDRKKEALEIAQEETADQLAELLAEQDSQIEEVRQTYQSLIHGTLSPDFNGRVRLSKDGLEFRIFRGENLSGEAFETLSILLSDMTVAVMGSIGSAHHPGLLIHDSPREADLGSDIYRRLLLCVSNVADELRNGSAIPVQYIITTTTPPPERLQNDNHVCLELGGEEGNLFKRQLHIESNFSQQVSLLDQEEK